MIVLAVVAASAAAWLIVPPTRSRRHARPRLARPELLRLSCAAAAVAVALAWGGVVGIAVGAVLAVLGPALLGRLESRGERRRREALERQLPDASDLLAACLSSGATADRAAVAVAQAMGDPIAAPLRRLVGTLQLGADPASAWAALADEPTLRPIARAATRSAETGAPLADLLVSVAHERRDEMRARAEAAARAAGVRAVAPLAACFLPAFLLIGVVPVVASLAGPLLG